MQDKLLVVYSPARWIVFFLAFVFLTVTLLIQILTFFIDFSTALFDMVIFLPLPIIWALLILRWGKKLYLEEKELVIRRHLIFCKEKRIPYADILNIDIRFEVTEPAIKVGVLYLTLKDGRIIRLDIPTGKRRDEFLLKLEENIKKQY